MFWGIMSKGLLTLTYFFSEEVMKILFMKILLLLFVLLGIALATLSQVMVEMVCGIVLISLAAFSFFSL